MKKDELVIGSVSTFALLFLIAPLMGIPDEIVFVMYFILPFLLAAMGIVILRSGKPSSHTFDEQFYDDLDYKRNGTEEGDR